MNRKSIFVVSSPSGGGKTTIVKRLLKRHPEIYYSISATTRPKRPGEKNRRDYHFMTEEKFKKLLLKKEFIEWAIVHGHCYGTLKAPLKKHREVLLDIDVQGAMQIKKALPAESVLIFILPPSFEELRRRLVRRHTDNPAEIKRRLKIAKKELGYLRRYDYAVVNRDINQALREIDSIIAAERLRVEK